jgi:Uma2 family endonuclease
MAAPIRPDRPPMTLAQFLWWEREQPVKHEFADGQVRAMTGTTLRHNEILQNISGRLRAAQRGSGCRTYVSDIQVRTPDGHVYYPDVAVGCGPRTIVDRHMRAPCAVVEVTSPTTQHVDRGEKLANYRAIPSLRAYVVADHTARRLECHLRDDAGAWRELVVADTTGVHEVAMPCLDVVLTLDDVYVDTEVFPPGPDIPPDEPLPPTA